MTRARSRRALLIVAASVVTTVTVFASRASVTAAWQQVRDAVGAPQAAGTGLISGRVMTDETDSQPVRRATVMLSAGGLQLPQTTVAGEAGEFEFSGLGPGNYTLVVQKAAYVTSYYGAKRPGKGPGVPIALLEGQRVADVVVRALHGSVITGVVRNQSGQPVVGLDVQALPLQLGAGDRQMAMPSGFAAQVAAAGGGGGAATTDDRGVYRIYGLAPGPYVLESRSDSLATTETRRVTAAEVQWALQAASQPFSAAPGGAAPPLDPAPSRGQDVNYAAVFYPGTVDPAAATTITLGRNEERNSVDFTTLLVPTAHVTGTLIESDGQPSSGGQISLRSSQAEAFDMLSMLIGGGGSRTAQDGRFTLSDVAPGHYVITARAAPRPQGGRQGPASPLSQMPPQLLALLGGPSGASTPMLWAMAEVSVDGRDVTDLTLTLQPGMTVSGKVVFDGAAPPADLTKVRVNLNTLPTSTSPIALAASMMLGSASASVEADGTFQMKGVMPDQYRIGAGSAGMLFGAALPAGWVLKSAMLGARDVSDVPFDVKPNQDVTGLVVTFTDRPPELSGTVFDQAGRPAPGFPIVVFSTDRAYWTIGSRRVQQARPSTDGKYKLTGLPAGEYYVSAVTDLDPNDLADPVFLEQLAATSFKITLGDGEKKTTDLKLSGGR